MCAKEFTRDDVFSCLAAKQVEDPVVLKLLVYRPSPGECKAFPRVSPPLRTTPFYARRAIAKHLRVKLLECIDGALAFLLACLGSLGGLLAKREMLR